MYKSLHLKTLLLLACLVMGVSTTWAADSYVLVKSASELSQGDVILITSGTDGSKKVLGAQSGNNCPAADVTISGETISSLGSGQEITLADVNTDGQFSFKVGTTSYLYAASSSKNQLKTRSTIAYWSIDINSSTYVASIQDETNTSNRRVLKFNSSDNLFSCYSSGQASVYVFKKVVAPSYTVTAESNNNEWGTVAVSGNKITATPASGYRVSTSAAYTVTSGEASVEQSGNVFTVTASADCTVRINFEAIPTHTITISTPTGGTLVVKNGDDTVASGSSVREGTTLTIVATPDGDHRFGSWKANENVFTDVFTYEMPATDVTFSATFNEIVRYAVTWMSNGSVYNTVNYEEGEDIVFPSGLADVDGKKFVGWVASEIVGTRDSEPSFVTSATMGTEAKNYYAVFATVTSTPGEITKTYGFETETDPDWTIDVSSRNSTYHNSGSYSGYIGKNNTYVTFKNKVNVTEFSFAFTRTSSNANYNVYIETSADNSNWTAASTYEMSSFNDDGTFTTKTKTFDGTSELYVRFHCYNTTAARYVDDVTIKYNGNIVTYSDYCTTVAADTRKLVNMTGFSAAKTTLVAGENTTTTVTNDQAGWTAAYTYTSSDPAVATVAADGTITAVAKGTATITAALNVDLDDPDYKIGKTTTSMTVDITVTKAFHTATFKALNKTVDEAELEEDADVTFPSVSNVGNYKFVGWTETPIVGSQDVTPTMADVDATTMGTSDVTYHAVFAIYGEENVTATFDASDVSNLTKGTEYSNDWYDNDTNINLWLSAGSRYTSGTPNTWSVTAGTSNYFYVAVDGWLTSIVTTIATVNSNYVIGSVDAGELGAYDAGTETQTITFDSNAKIDEVQCFATSSYQIRASKIVVNAVMPSYSGYRTSITTPVKVTAAGYATFCSELPLDFTGAEVTAYTAAVEDDAVTFNAVTKYVPANAGILLKGDANTYEIPVAYEPVAAELEDVTGNALVGVNENTKINQTEGGKTNFVLLKKDGVVGFFKVNATKGFTVGAHTAYLSAAVSDPAKGFFGFDDNTTAVNSVLSVSEEAAPAYNLQGQRVSDSYRGVVIVNGKKFVNK